MTGTKSDQQPEAEARRIAWAVLLIAMSLLAFELVVTRIFSVILWNHFAFLAISIGLFGFGVAGVLVYLMPNKFTRDRAYEHIRKAALLLSPVIWLVVTLLCVLPIRMDFSTEMFAYLSLIFLLTTLPFVVGGVGLTLALSHWPQSVNRIYAFDLVGSAIGCVLVIVLLGALAGPSAALAIGVLPVLAALVLKRSKLTVLLGLAVIAGVAVNQSTDWVRIRMSRSRAMAPLFEQWNAFSQVTVSPTAGGIWRGWAPSPHAKHPPVKALGVRIDGDAFTPLVKFDGNLDSVRVLLDDISSVAYQYRPDAPSVLVIGSGGGKDVLAALASGAGKVRAVELNPIIANSVVRGAFRDYTGDLYRHPRVELEVGEGRTVLRHDQRKYDILQLSMVDTSAASAAGAYALTENSLYTVGAAREFLQHLKKGGVATCTWGNIPNLEGLNRLVSVYSQALREMGIAKVDDKIAVVGAGILGSVLIQPSGFTPAQSQRIAILTKKLGFQALYIPGLDIADHPLLPAIAVIRELLTSNDLEAFFAEYPLDLTPVDDDRPFFFYQSRFRDAWGALLRWQGGSLYGNGLFIIVKLLVISSIAVLLFMFLPLLIARRSAQADFKGTGTLVGYFLALGAGFITLEIALIQLFGYYLGHPLLGLGVSLTSILFFTGLGSAFAGRWPRTEIRLQLRRVLGAIIVLALAGYLALPALVEATVGSHVVIRCALAAAATAPFGLLLGMPFPSGLRLLGDASRLTPWMWSLNGGASVFGAAFATLLVMHLGFAMTLAIGGAIYGLALLMLEVSPRVELRQT